MAFVGDEREWLLDALDTIATDADDAFGRGMDLRTSEVFAPYHKDDAGDLSVGNVRADDGDDAAAVPFLLAIHVRSAVRRAGEADAFFAAAADAAQAPARVRTRPLLMLFVARDEAAAGRAWGVQAGLDSVAITITDSRLNPGDLVQIVDRLDAPMRRYDDLATDMTDYAHASRMRFGVGRTATHAHLLDLGLQSTTARALSHARDLVIATARRVLDDVQSRVARRRAAAPAQPPDLAVLLSACRGPVVALGAETLPAGVLAAAKFAAGDGALVVSSIECGDAARAAWTTACERYPAARVVLLVAAEDSMPHDTHAQISVGVRDGANPAIVIDTRGITVAHVAHFCEVVYGAALNARRALVEHMEWNLCEEIENALLPAGSTAAEHAIVELQVRRVHARATIARHVRGGLARTKARLWHPSGRLARRMFTEHVENAAGVENDGQGADAAARATADATADATPMVANDA